MKYRIVQSIIENIGHAHPNDMGLFNGKMGVCLALYYAYMETHQEYIEKSADGLLDDIVLKMSQMNDLSFDKGILGIGWAINKLHMEACIEGDIDDILYNIDASLYRAFTEPYAPFFNSMSNTLGALVYIADRLYNPLHDGMSIQHLLHNDMLRLIVNKLSVMSPVYFANINRDVAPCVMWEYYALFNGLKKIMNLGLFNDQIDKMMYMWEGQLCTSFPFFHNNRLSFASALASLNVSLGHESLNEYTNWLLCSIDENAIQKEAISHIHCISIGWVYAVWNLNSTIRSVSVNADVTQMLTHARSVIIRKGLRELSLELNRKKTQNVSLVGGLSGILLLLYSKISL